MYRGWRSRSAMWFLTVILLSSLIMGQFIPEIQGLRTYPAIRGKVTDTTGSPMEGVGVRVGAMDGLWFNGTYTNSTGDYLVNLSGPGMFRMGFVRDGYFEYTQGAMIPDNGVYTVNAVLTELPEEDERIVGSLKYENGAPAPDKVVYFTYEEGSNRYEYEVTTDQDGEFELYVFPGQFNIEVRVHGLTKEYGDIDVIDGVGTFEIDLELPILPPKDCLVKGYVSDGDGPVPGTVVAIMDPENDIVNMTNADGEGYFELGFWAGTHYLLSMAEGFEFYFRGAILVSGGVIWSNITLVREEFVIDGTVFDPRGEPMEGATVQYLQAFVHPESNTDISDGSGHFSMEIARGDGFLMVADENPFETGEFDVYFRPFTEVSVNISHDIHLTNLDRITAAAGVTFDGWAAFSSMSRMTLPLNNSRAGRAMIDLMMGDGDMIISEPEFELWEDAMMGEDSDLQEGPFGDLTDKNFTLNGIPFQHVKESQVLEFFNFTGPVAGDNPFELHQGADYTLTDDEPEGFSRTLSFNISYPESSEMTFFHLRAPSGWRSTSITESDHIFTPKVNQVFAELVDDPNSEDDIDHQWVDLVFHDDEFDVNFEAAEGVLEGEPVELVLNVTDHLPDNEYDITWNVNGTEVAKTENTTLVYTFEDDGEYVVIANMTDSYGRETRATNTVDVEGVAPEVNITVVGGLNRTFYEGDTIEIAVNMSDVQADPLTLRWGMNGDFGPVRNDTFENRTRTFRIQDDGLHAFQVKVFDGDGITVMDEVRITAENVAPDYEVEISENGLPGDGSVVQGEVVTIEITGLVDPSLNDTHSVDWTVPDDGLEHHVQDEGHSLSLIFYEPGPYVIEVNVSDEDGGWKMVTISLTVSENISFDMDLDGMPRWWEKNHTLSDDNPDDASMDPDSDGLTNLEEFEAGTDPDLEDTDGDGVPDKWDGKPRDDQEWEKDSDNDGYSDWEEFQEGTDPFDPDSNLDEDDDSDIWVYAIMIVIGLLLAAGVIILMASRSREKALEYEE